MTTKIQTVEELEVIVSKLRASGVHNINAKQMEFDIRFDIILKSNARRLHFAASKLPKFDGDFSKYRTECLIFFNAIREKKKEKKLSKTILSL